MTVKEQILAVLAKSPQPLTDEELILVTGGNPNTVRPRRIELEAEGKVVAAALVKTKSGKYAFAWTLPSKVKIKIGNVTIDERKGKR